MSLMDKSAFKIQISLILEKSAISDCKNHELIMKQHHLGKHIYLW